MINFRNTSNLPYIVIIILIIVVFIQSRGCGDAPTPKPPKIDTVIKIVKIKDTVYVRPAIIKTKIDTLWITRVEYKPDTNYPKLLEQYRKLGDKHFVQNIFRTNFNIGSYGHITITDTITTNLLVASSIESKLVIPERIVTVEKVKPPSRELYFGTLLTGNTITPINAVYGALLYKDRKDKIFSAGVGYNGMMQFSLGTYWKIK